MSDMIASMPLNGPTTYDFGEATPDDWPRSYVAEEDYRELFKRVETLERDRHTAESENETLRTANREFALNEAKTSSGWFIQTARELSAALREIAEIDQQIGLRVPPNSEPHGPKRLVEAIAKAQSLIGFAPSGGKEHG